MSEVIKNMKIESWKIKSVEIITEDGLMVSSR